MSTVPIIGKSAPRALARKLWIAFRFIVFGVGGFLLLWGSAITLVTEFDTRPEHWMTPYLELPLACVGALMMLFGSGEWGRWAYLLVFISSPLAMFLILVIPWPKWFDDIMGGSFIVVLALPFFLTYMPVRRYYRRRDAKSNSALKEDLPGPIPEEQTAK